MQPICSDLKWEQGRLDALVDGLAQPVWERLTPCGEWTVKDQISHLAYFDHSARLAATDADKFTRRMIEDLGRVRDMAEADAITLARGRALSTRGLLEWWRQERRSLLAALKRLDPKDRLPWYGPPMSARSFATARLMETWAHGQDVYDALGLTRPPSPGLRHVAHLGVATFKWSFSNRGLEVPETPVRVELIAPNGEIWTWEEKDTEEKITGPAEDFCLVVTQRRHLEDTALVAHGAVARKWMQVAQAFAGPPTLGPPPGKSAALRRG
jgi:uncharacterized protein (TIGR03084 family)